VSQLDTISTRIDRTERRTAGGTVDETLSWIIAIGNPITALLVGPTVETFWGPTPSRRAATLGWVGLFITQFTFLAFGYASGYVAFRVAQPCMLPISMWNYYLVTTSWARRRRTPLVGITTVVTDDTRLRRSRTRRATDDRTTTASDDNGTRELRRVRTFRQA
jgi:hypothetical protein